MTDEMLRAYSAEECVQGRQEMLDGVIRPVVTQTFELFDDMQSAVLLVAQYWNDEADDAVHAQICYSLSPNPDIDAYLAETIRIDDKEKANDQEPSHSISQEQERIWIASQWLIEGMAAQEKLLGHWNDADIFRLQDELSLPRQWPNDHEAVPYFAAFCSEGAHQDAPIGRAYTPYAIFKRTNSKAVPEMDTWIIGKMLRPWLDGVAGEWQRIPVGNSLFEETK